MTSDPAERESGRQPKAKVFISYSRKDIAFADRLDAALKQRGFEPLIDRTDIYAFEEWWKRIEELIGRADTVVFVLSPDAVRPGSVARKEVAFAASLNKRFAPVVFRPVEDNALPEELAKLNFIFFDDPTRFEQSADQLAEALATDLGWIRQHTDFGDQARRWALADRPNGLLLRSPVLEQAERWIAGRPSEAPAPTEETQRFIRRGRQAATRRRNIFTGSLAAGLVLALGLAGLAYWQRGIAQKERDRAVQAEQTATEQKEIAQQQRDRAEKTLSVATNTANTLVSDLAVEFRDRTGIPIDLVRRILDRAYQLQRQLTEAGETAPDLRHSEAVARSEMVVTLQRQGDSKTALTLAEHARSILEELVASDPKQLVWQRDLTILLNRMASVLKEVGRRDDALEAYRTALAIRERLAAADPSRPQYQRDLAFSYQQLEELLQNSGRSAEARQYRLKKDAIEDKLAGAGPNSATVRNANATNVDQMRREDAIDLRRKEVAIAEQRAAADPGNSLLQGDLDSAYVRYGEALLSAGRRQEALDIYRKGLAIREMLVTADPGNRAWQRELIVSYLTVGDLYSIRAIGRRRSPISANVLRSPKRSLPIHQSVLVSRPGWPMSGSTRCWPRPATGRGRSMTTGEASDFELVAVDPINVTWRDLAVMYNKMGDFAEANGRREEALSQYGKGLAIAEKIAAADQTNPNAQRDVSVTRGRIGRALVHAGRLDQALEHFYKSQAIDEKLVVSDPGNIEWQNDLANRYVTIGDVITDADKRREEEAAYEKSLAIRQRLAESDPGNAEWQSELAIVYQRTGYALMEEGRREDALATYQKSLSIHAKLADSDKENIEWQSGLAWDYEFIGHALEAQDEVDEALAAYRKSLNLRQQLVDREPNNVNRHREVSSTYHRMGWVLKNMVRNEEALAAYEKMRAIAQRLVDEEPGNAEWQDDLATAYSSIGDMLTVQRKYQQAQTSYNQALVIQRKIVAANPGNATWLRNFAIIYERMGDLLKKQNRFDETLQPYEKSRELMQRLADSDPGNTRWRHSLQISYTNIGDVLEAQEKNDEALFRRRWLSWSDRGHRPGQSRLSTRSFAQLRQCRPRSGCPRSWRGGDYGLSQGRGSRREAGRPQSRQCPLAAGSVGRLRKAGRCAEG
jgi:tetratricopeptide (TPR) repeat protein